MPRGERRAAPRNRAARGGRPGRTTLVLVLSVVLVLAAGGYAAYDAGWLDRFLGADEATPEAIPPPPGVRLPPPAQARPVLASATAGATTSATAGAKAPTRAQLRRHLADTLHNDSLGRHVGVLVQQLGSSRDLLRVGGDDLFTPASSMKLLTTTTALKLLGPDHRFSTTVQRGDSRRSIVLVGGGDPLLTQRRLPPGTTYPREATLADLARQTAKRLESDGIHRVRLGYDASLFSGPAANPHWEPSYVPDGVVSEISALWVDEGREAPESSIRSADPAEAAAVAFAQELERAGITVRGTPTASTAPKKSPQVAEVRSAPLAQIVQHILELSDNEGAEVMLRQAAVASGRKGTFANGVDAVRNTLTGLGVDVRRARFYDGSGLSRSDRLPLDALAGALQVAASPAHPGLRRVVSGLPVAGFSGSLAYRYVTLGAEGRGLVRAKTGTLTGVHALVGVTVDRDGAPLVFVTVADKVRLLDTLDARAGLDALTADIATCC